MKTILSLTNLEAKKHFLRNDVYCNFDIPRYFDFSDILLKVDKNLRGSVEKTDLNKESESVNCKIFLNKDGKYAWRLFQLIHPVLYVELVKKITEKTNWGILIKRFNLFKRNKKIECVSLPVVDENQKQTLTAQQILNWWENVEQKSIEQAMDFCLMFKTDITDCYPSIYTHSIAWAIHDRDFIKIDKNRFNNKLIGNVIDKSIRNMSATQTNGIPQGSVLMDFIAEIILGYVDLLLSNSIKNKKISNYKIIRYRDDYRIFVNNAQDGELIIKLLSEILAELGLKLNSSKTSSTSNLIIGSIKPEKMHELSQCLSDDKLNNQKRLLKIYDFSTRFPNVNALKKLLNHYYENLYTDNLKSDENENINVLISIVIDLAFNNPTTYPIASAILSKFLKRVSRKAEKENIIKRIKKKFSTKPNNVFIALWIQRISYKLELNIKYSDNICKILTDEKIELWNSKWLKNKTLKSILADSEIINREILDNMTDVIDQDEVDAFKYLEIDY